MAHEEEKEVQWSKAAEQQMLWLEEQGLKTMRGAVVDQLRRDPINSKKKRVAHLEGDVYELCYRTWRVIFEHLELGKACSIQRIHSGYTVEELESLEDPYGDKGIHKAFNKV